MTASLQLLQKRSQRCLRERPTRRPKSANVDARVSRASLLLVQQPARLPATDRSGPARGEQRGATRRGSASFSTSTTSRPWRANSVTRRSARSNTGARGRWCRTRSGRRASRSVGHLDDGDAIGLQHLTERRATKPLRSGTCASTLLAWMTSACCPSATSAAARRRPKNSLTRRHAARLGDRGDVGGRLDAEDRHPALRRSA